MATAYQLTPGPSELYFTVEDHIKTALSNRVAAISHRSAEYVAIHKETEKNIRELLSVPAEYHVAFVNSATEIFERVLQNCVTKNTFHFINGSFSKRFYQTAQDLGFNAQKSEVAFGEVPDLMNTEIPTEVEIICTTQNETSCGVMLPPAEIEALSAKYPEKLIAVDMVSAAPYPDLDISKVDTVLFSVQKCFGLPAGLGVWIFSPRCVEKALAKKAAGGVIGSHYSIPSILDKAKKFQTPITPNVLGIYLLGKVAKDMLDKGLDVIRQEIDAKAAAIYHAIEESNDFDVFVKEPKYRSKTVAVANHKAEKSGDFINELIEKTGVQIGAGYGSYKSKQIRIANFPTHSKERVYSVIDNL